MPAAGPAWLLSLFHVSRDHQLSGFQADAEWLLTAAQPAWLVAGGSRWLRYASETSRVQDGRLGAVLL